MRAWTRPRTARAPRRRRAATVRSRLGRTKLPLTTTCPPELRGSAARLHRRFRQLGQLDRPRIPRDEPRAYPGGSRSSRRRARYPAARRGPVRGRRLHSARGLARGGRRLCQRPKPGARSAQQGCARIHSEVRPDASPTRSANGVNGSRSEAEKELAEFYPKDADGATPIAYLWARTIQCEGPGCGAEVPLMRSLWLAKKSNRPVGLHLMPKKKAKRVDFQIIIKRREGWVDQSNPEIKIENPKFDGTVKRGSATCRCCGFTTPVARVREQLKVRRGGATTARLFVLSQQIRRRWDGFIVCLPMST